MRLKIVSLVVNIIAFRPKHYNGIAFPATEFTTDGEPEGQHPLTGQRAANFKLLANQ